jgi:hypothetical protein
MMSDDLVKRLREHEEQQQVAGSYWWETPEVCKEAADRIEDLEARVAAADKLEEAVSNMSGYFADFDGLRRNAEQALAAYRAAKEGE